MSVNYTLIGQRIKKRRKAAGLTQEQLAEQLFVSVGYVSQIERGITKANLDMLSNICLAVGCDLPYLFTGSMVEQGAYMEDELLAKCRQMNAKQKQMAIKIIDILLEK